MQPVMRKAMKIVSGEERDFSMVTEKGSGSQCLRNLAHEARKGRQNAGNCV